LGSPEEAADYAAEFRGSWRETPGALAWLRQVLSLPAVAEREAAPKSKRARPSEMQRLEQRRDEIWQVIVACSNSEGEATGVMVVSNQSDQEPLASEPLTSEPLDAAPTEDAVWEVLERTMLRPSDREPRRPGLVEYAHSTHIPAWVARLKQIGVKCRASDELAALAQTMAQQPAQALQAREKPIAAAEILALPRNPGEVWQFGVGRFPGWLGDADNPRRAWAGLVVERDDQLVLAHDMTEDELTPDWLVRLAARAIMGPMMGPPHRPMTIEVATPERAAALRSACESWKVNVKPVAKLKVWDELFAQMTDSLSDADGLRGIVEVPGMKLEQVATFYEAAAEFFRRRPWRRVPADTPFRIDCPRFETGTWYTFVMGQSGLTLGLAMYDDLAAVKRLVSGAMSQEDHVRRMSGISLTYGEAFETPIRDVNAAEEHGWPLAAPEAYPCVIRLVPGMNPRPPLNWELALLEGALRALPDFVDRTGEEPLSLTVKAAGDELPLTLSWRCE
jgi:hypothetical protein